MIPADGVKRLMELIGRHDGPPDLERDIAATILAGVGSWARKA